MTFNKRTAGIALPMILGLAACQAPVQEVTSTEQTYRDTCLLCHAGQGPGTMLPDLTRLSQVNGGQFPMDQVIEIIDGRAEVRAHGSPMPVWGERYSPDQVHDMAEYLASIQQ